MICHPVSCLSTSLTWVSRLCSSSLILRSRIFSSSSRLSVLQFTSKSVVESVLVMFALALVFLPLAACSSLNRTFPVLSHSSQARNHAESAGSLTILSRHLSSTMTLSFFWSVISDFALLQLGTDRAIIAKIAIINLIDSFLQFCNFTFKPSQFVL